MKRVHYTDSYLLVPQHPVTVNLIGGGGTGSQVLTNLARLDVTLRALGHPGLFVTLYDPDIVTEANIGRQLFGYSDLGLNKANCLITRINNFFGNDWKAVPALYPSNMKDARQEHLANITITCTDNIKSRIDLWNILKAVPACNYTNYQTPLYWLDFGNTQSTGQVVLGSVPKKIKQPSSQLYQTVPSLKVITKLVKYARIKEEDSGPSCSLAEALEKQDLFINSTLAQLGCNILWKMFRHGMIEHHGLYLNLSTMKVIASVVKGREPGSDTDFSMILANVSDKKKILRTMIESCEKDIVDLKIAMTAENRESMRSIAHRMFPMWEMVSMDEILLAYRNVLKDTDCDTQTVLNHTNHIITHIEHLIEDAGNEIERIADEEKNIDSRG